ncbi:MAG: hypothetical protein JWM11_7674 [Planctomycetaceae bacterium]|nr:hypothetical protein [Planctomycetaceae bacterium]
MSKRLGLAIVAAGLMLSLSGVADAAVLTKANANRTVVTRNVRPGTAVTRRVHVRHHHRRVVNTVRNKASMNTLVAHRSHRHINNRHVTVRHWHV